MRVFLCLTLALTAMAAAPARAQDDDDSGQTVCVSGPQWHASLADSAAIRTEPVPASYRHLFESTEPCTRWALDEESLIDWHLRFGTAESVVPALTYLELDYRRGEPAPEAYRTMLERAWTGALRDLQRARAVQQPQGVNYSAQARFVEASRPIQRFETLVATREKYIFLATQYLRAAEEFGLLALLDKADLYLRAAVAGSDFLGPLETRPPVQNVLYFNLHTYITDDLEMRAAVLRAALTRNAADLARAETVVESKARPYFGELAEHAFSHGDDFCDIQSDIEQESQTHQTCVEDDEAQTRVVNQLLARATLDLVADRENAYATFDLAIRLLDRERLQDRGRCCMRNADDDIVRLRLAHVAYLQRLLSRPEDPGHANHVGNWQQALTDLETAERLTPAHLAPGRLRRIALAWLALWPLGDALLRTEENQHVWPNAMPERQGYAAYLRSLLASLDAIAAGADPGLPPRAN